MRLDILKWNPINDEFGEVRASVYIKPTLDFLEFINKNNGNGNRTYMVNISNTKHPIYDGMPYLGIVDKSSDVANCRQNFYQSTGLYIVMLSVRWFGYPEQNGSIEFMEGILTDTYGTQPLKDTKNITDAKVNEVIKKMDEPKNIENYENYEKIVKNNENNDENNEKKEHNYVLYAYIILFLIVLVYVINTFSHLTSGQK